MRTTKVTVLPYDSAWKTAFEAIKAEIESALGKLILGIEHVGSTSVEGMSAKPCIDLDVIIKDDSMLDAVIERLAEIGYIHEGDLGIKGREAFKYTDKPHLMKHHLYVCTESSDELRRHIVFRDFLRNNPDAAKRYSDIKEMAAKLYPNDIDKYIELKNNILSPSTVRSYRAMRRSVLPDLLAEPLMGLTQERIQAAINELAGDCSPKYCRNVHGLISAVCKQYRPDFQLHTTMPQRQKTEICIPTEDEMQKLFEYVRGTDAELPVYLGACCGLRRSEVLGLKWKDIDFAKGTMTIHEAIVLNEDNEAVSKSTKTIAGTRTIRMYPFVREVLERMPRDGEHVVALKGHQVYQRFQSALEACGLPHYRFHDLRHYLVSVMLSLNIPKAYIADYVGHETENMIDQVYGHIMAFKKTNAEDLLHDYFNGAVMKSDTKSDTVRK